MVVVAQVSQGVHPVVHSPRIWGPKGTDPPAFPYLAKTWVVALYFIYRHNGHINKSVSFTVKVFHHRKFLHFPMCDVEAMAFIYLIPCRRCGQQHVCKTGQPLHLRINGHRFNITHGKTEESPVAEHFNGERHTFTDVTVVAIDKIHSHNSCLCKIRESRWIRIMRISYPSGMNLRVDSRWDLRGDHHFLPRGSVVPLFDNKAQRYN